jgi:hypothetical protein
MIDDPKPVGPPWWAYLLVIIPFLIARVFFAKW